MEAADDVNYSASQITEAFNAWKCAPASAAALASRQSATRRPPVQPASLRLHARLHVYRHAIGRKYNNMDGEALELRAFAANTPLVAT